uniref:Ovule protein n=1 Tax=Steinernema glaseri TaxID=37863 RepID=A0A1I7YXG2_9BILA
MHRLDSISMPSRASKSSTHRHPIERLLQPLLNQLGNCLQYQFKTTRALNTTDPKIIQDTNLTPTTFYSANLPCDSTTDRVHPKVTFPPSQEVAFYQQESL